MTIAPPAAELLRIVGSCFFDHPDYDGSLPDCPACVAEREARSEDPASSRLARTERPEDIVRRKRIDDLRAEIDQLLELQRADRLERFQNKHLSVSRLKRYEQCPASFELHYIRELPSEQTLPLLFGTFLHEVLERLYRWVVEEEHSGRIPEDKLTEFYRDAWVTSGLSGGTIYAEGLAILRSYLRQNPEVDHLEILGVEIEFNLQVEEFLINGRIDRVDRIDDATIAIIDYKSNRMLFSRDEVDTDLQMSVYALAAKELYPWAKRVVFVFHMLRHGVELDTERSEMQIEDARGYVLAIGRQTETAKTFPAKLNPNCGYCDHRRNCDAYQNALKLGAELVANTPEDLDLISRAREKLHAIGKIVDGRKRELETIIRAQLQDKDSVVLGEVTYKLVPWTQSTSYPLEKTLELLGSVTDTEGLRAFDVDEVLRRAVKIDPKKLEGLIDDAKPKIGGAKSIMLKAQLEAIAEKTAGTPRFQATPLKGRGKRAQLAEATELPLLPEANTLPPESSSPTIAEEAAETKPEPEKRKRAPTQLACGWYGYGRAIKKHRDACEACQKEKTRDP